jgi:hypothetical protein
MFRPLGMYVVSCLQCGLIRNEEAIMISNCCIELVTLHTLPGPTCYSLAMELVALRDIQPHEEIFLDYGDAWESN